MAKTRRLERLAKREEKATIKRIVYLSLLTVVLGAFLLTFGVSVLGKLTDTLSSIFGGRDDAKVSQADVRPPVLDTLPSATSSAAIAVSGFADEGATVSVYIDDTKVGDAQVSDGKFTFSEGVLKKGKNTIKAKAVVGTAESEYSQSADILYDNEEPKLAIEGPSDGQSFSGDNRIKVSGTAESDSQVYANGFLASINASGHFEVFVPVGEGETNIEIKAIDDAGNTKVENRKVSFHR